MKINPTLPTAMPFSKNAETVNQTSIKGEMNFTLYQVSEPIVTKVVALRTLLDKLNLRNNPPPMPAGWVGGPGTLPLFAFKGELKELQKYFNEIETTRSDDQLLVNEINNLLNALVPAYENNVGLGTYYPDAKNSQTRYVDANGTEVSRDAFEAIKERYLVALDEALEHLKTIQRSLNFTNV